MGERIFEYKYTKYSGKILIVFSQNLSLSL